MSHKLTDKTIYITGGTGGIGRPLVDKLREAGAQVTCYDHKTDGDLVKNLDRITEMLRQNTPDILINLAGYNVFDYAENQDYAAQLNLNLLVPMVLTQAVLPDMKKRGSGQIVNIGSMTALIPLPHLTGYVASKAGLKAFTDSLRREVEAHGISLTFITPRAVKTAANSGSKEILNARTKVNYDPAEKIADRIFKAILNHEKEVRIGWPERFFALLNSIFPRLIDKGLDQNRRIGEEILNAEMKKKEGE